MHLQSRDLKEFWNLGQQQATELSEAFGLLSIQVIILVGETWPAVTHLDARSQETL